jgi:hypothetical protein
MQFTIIGDHFRHTGALSVTDKRITQLSHDTLDGTVMNVMVCSVKVTDGLLGAAIF